MKKREEFLEKMKASLVARRDELGVQLSSQSAGRMFEGQVKDLGDEALSISHEKLQSSVEKTEIDELNLISQALKRIESGEYGVCIDCSKSISNKRLQHSPFAARCIVCQEEFEG